MKEVGCYDNERGSVIKVIGILLIYASDLTVSFKLFSEIVFEILNELCMNLKWIVNGVLLGKKNACKTGPFSIAENEIYLTIIMKLCIQQHAGPF